jgi:hypothetical protein
MERSIPTSAVHLIRPQLPGHPFRSTPRRLTEKRQPHHAGSQLPSSASRKRRSKSAVRPKSFSATCSRRPVPPNTNGSHCPRTARAREGLSFSALLQPFIKGHLPVYWAIHHRPPQLPRRTIRDPPPVTTANCSLEASATVGTPARAMRSLHHPSCPKHSLSSRSKNETSLRFAFNGWSSRLPFSRLTWSPPKWLMLFPRLHRLPWFKTSTSFHLLAAVPAHH